MNPLLQQALSFHQSGNIAEAERAYAEVLRLDPQDFTALYFMGLLGFQQRRHDRALTFLDRALALKPNHAEALAVRSVALCQMGRFQEAVTGFDQALALTPNAPELIGNRALALCYLGRLDEAAAGYDRLLALQPQNLDALTARAGVYAELGLCEAAIADLDRAMAASPPRPQWLHSRALAFMKLGRLDEALADMDHALGVDPKDADGWNNRCGVLKLLGRPDEALASLDKATALNPDMADAFFNKAVILRELGRPEEALANLDRAIAKQPTHAEAWNDRGLVLHWDLKRTDEALASLDKALAIRPGHAGALNNRGLILREIDRNDEALASFDRALAAQPNFPAALYNRANMLWIRKQQFEAARADLERLVTLNPDYEFALGDLVHLKMYCGDWEGLSRQKALIDAGVRAGKRVIVPFAYEGLSDSPADLQACARIYASSKFPAAPSVATRTGRRDGKICIGYVCGEFREQATQHLAVGLYESHDRSRFEVIAFDNGQSDGSAMRSRVESAFDKIIDISTLAPQAAAERAAAEEIDILVNLNGYFGKQRADLFARRPAPIQVNFLGFPGTLGAPYMDYILADRCVIPEEEQAFYDEQVVYLPGSYQVNDNRRQTPEPALSRAEHGLPESAFVFCHFNQSYKLTPDTFDVWMRLLDKTPGSVLWLLQSSGPFSDNLRREAQARGVSGERLIFAPMIDHQPHLARLPLGDLFLDSLPYNAHTTASDALWMGLPLVTCKGQTFPGRVAASLLGAVGLPELVTEDIQAYEALALALAAEPDRLKVIRQKLADGRATAPLFDTAGFTRHIEAAYTAMLDRWARGGAPKGFSVA